MRDQDWRDAYDNRREYQQQSIFSTELVRFKHRVGTSAQQRRFKFVEAIEAGLTSRKADWQVRPPCALKKWARFGSAAAGWVR